MPPHDQVVVFTGTSLALAEARAALPEAVVRGPIVRGDLGAVRARGATVVAIVDGAFDQSLAVSPFEIRAALAAGVAVFGAASMGALRAAELWVLGMVGVGTVFEWYRSGEVMADADVAVAFDAETLRPLSVPRVNVRHALAHAARAGLLTRDDAAALLAAAEQIPYPELTYRRLLRDALPPAFPARDALERCLAGCDLKRDDARACLAAVRAYLQRPRAPDAPPAG